jgi:hypothetical protein
MITENVVVRSVNQQRKMNKNVLDGLVLACKRNEPIPIVYQYLHNPNRPFRVDEDNTIGKAYYLNCVPGGDIVASVEINQMLRLSVNWQGVIDNVAVSYHPEIGKKGAFMVDAFIIYDAEAKAAIDKKKENTVASLNQKLAKPGVVPFVSSSDNDAFMKNAADTILKEFKKQAEKQADNQTEGGTSDESNR